jgi:hypothetical protein
MPTNSADPFPTEALEPNRGGRLTTEQRDRLRPLARYARQSALLGAVILVVAALMIVSDRQPFLPAALRAPLAGVCVVFAAVFLLRAIAGADALSRDLRHMKVQLAEGPIGKHRGRSQGRSGRRSYLFDVGDETYRVASRLSYDAAPDAGIVRVYFLPRSRRVVNLERLPDVAFASGTTPHDVMASLGTAMRSHNRREFNEIRAKMAPMMEAIAASRDEPVTPPPLGARDPRPLEEAIVGTWRSAILTVTFDANGSVSATMVGGMQRRGRWSVNRSGRLVADVMGREDAAEAWIVGDGLTIVADGRALEFTRQ